MSPDGKILAFVRATPSYDVWIRDLSRGVSARVTNDGGSETLPVWSADGSLLAYAVNRDALGSAIYEKAASGLTAERLLVRSEAGSFVFPNDWSPEGKHFVYGSSNSGRMDLDVLSERGGRATPYLVDGFQNRSATFSPDRRWLAYTSNESGVNQVFVRAFPDPAGVKYQVSTEGARFHAGAGTDASCSISTTGVG